MGDLDYTLTESAMKQDKNKKIVKVKERENKKGQKSESHTVNLGTWNVRGLNGKEDELTEELSKMNMQYVGITETKRKGKGVKKLPNGYWMYWSGVEAEDNAGAGVALLVKEENMKNIKNEKYVNERILSVKIKEDKDEEYTLFVCYGPNDNARKEEKDKFFIDLQEEIDSTNNRIIIMGDLNGRVGKNNKGIEYCLGKYGEETRNDNGSRVIELCVENELKIGNTYFMKKEINKMTRQVISRREKSIIDYFLIQKDMWRKVKDVEVKRGPEIGSDHFLLKMVLKTEKVTPEKCKRKIVNNKIKCYKLRQNEFKQEYQKICEDMINSNIKKTKIEEKWEDFKNIILIAAESACGSTKITNRNIKKTNWWTENIKVAIKDKKKKWIKYLQTRNQIDYGEYKQQRVYVKQVIKEEKEKSWKKFGEKMKNAYTDNQKLFFGTLKNMRQKKTEITINIKDKNGNVIGEEEKIMERWREYFKELLEGKDINMKNRSINQRLQHEIKNMKTEEINIEDIREAIQKLKLGKAPGHDNITTDMIKALPDKAIEELVEIMNEIMQDVAPEDWTTGIITPIYKKGDSKKCQNYRGITLTSTVAKVYARILEKRLRVTLEPTLEETQFGFRPNRGVNDAIFIMRQIGEKTIKENKNVHVCFIDLEKAFDKIKREDIWKILIKRGVSENLIKGIQSLYKETKNYVRIKQEKSKLFETTIGLRQGCILSPVLFTVVLDEAIKEAKKDLKQYEVGHWKMEQITVSDLCYADDIVIIAKNEKTLNLNMEIYKKALQKVNMTISKEKTQTMIIGNTEQHVVKLGEEKLEQVNRFKYLGTIITGDGRIDEEIRERTAAGGRLFNSIKNSFLGKKEIPKDIRVEIFKKVVTPILIYGAETWTMTEKQKSKITAIEMRFLRKMENKTKIDKIRNTTFRQNLKIRPTVEKIEEAQMRWYGHVKRMSEERIVRQVLEARTSKRKARGRPRKTWLEEIRTAATKRGVTWEEVSQTTHNRKIWKEICKRKTQ